MGKPYNYRQQTVKVGRYTVVSYWDSCWGGEKWVVIDRAAKTQLDGEFLTEDRAVQDAHERIAAG